MQHFLIGNLFETINFGWAAKDMEGTKIVTIKLFAFFILCYIIFFEICGILPWQFWRIYEVFIKYIMVVQISVMLCFMLRLYSSHLKKKEIDYRDSQMYLSSLELFSCNPAIFSKFIFFYLFFSYNNLNPLFSLTELVYKLVNFPQILN